MDAVVQNPKVGLRPGPARLRRLNAMQSDGRRNKQRRVLGRTRLIAGLMAGAGQPRLVKKGAGHRPAVWRQKTVTQVYAKVPFAGGIDVGPGQATLTA